MISAIEKNINMLNKIYLLPNTQKYIIIYCSNEYISFNHLSKEILSNKYLFKVSIFDINQLNYIISNFNIKTIKKKIIIKY